MLVETILGKLEDIEIGERSLERIALDHYDMAKPHQKLKTDAGTSVAVSLPHGQQLFCGAVLYEDDETVIFVDLLPEEALEIRPVGNLEWGRAAFNIGNMHHPAYLYEDCIRIPYDGIIENMIKEMGFAYTKGMYKLDGLRANHVTRGGHGHSHSHAHSHEHEHGHEHGHGHGHEHPHYGGAE